MPKQTSTALNVNDLFSDDNVNPPSGDTASQGQITMKSDRASASAARPSRPAVVDTADHSGGINSITWYATIWCSVDAAGKWYYNPGSNVHTSGHVYLNSASPTTVTTIPSAAFGGTGSYPTNTGTPYQLVSTIKGTVTLTTASGTTGTINVGP
jgi:hypothetical protein